VSVWHDLLFDYTLRTVALGAAILGAVGGALGAFALLRRQALLGDAVSHAALPGIVLAFVLTGSKAPLVLILGAAAAGWLASVKVMVIVRHTRVKADTALGLVLAVFFGLGLVMLTLIQRSAGANQSGLDRFLFGQAAAIMTRDVVTMGALGGGALLLVALFWKEFKLLSFDPDYGAILGYPVRALDILLTSLVVVAIVIGLQTVGVVLMSAMLVAPAAGARQWTDRLGLMVVLSGLFGAAAGVAGAVVSSLSARLPTGPVIVVCATILVAGSLLLAPNRGLVWSWARRARSRRRLRTEAVLADLYRLASQHARPTEAPHSTSVLRTMADLGGVRRSLAVLAERGLVRDVDDDRWVLTDAGVAEARRQAEIGGGAEASRGRDGAHPPGEATT
jgi:manganese/zinc/iron transport system permease protein